MLYHLASELDEIVMDVVAARYMADELVKLDKVDLLHGGLQRALWRVFDSIKGNIEALRDVAFDVYQRKKDETIDLNVLENIDGAVMDDTFNALSPAEQRKVMYIGLKAIGAF